MSAAGERDEASHGSGATALGGRQHRADEVRGELSRGVTLIAKPVGDRGDIGVVGVGGHQKDLDAGGEPDQRPHMPAVRCRYGGPARGRY